MQQRKVSFKDLHLLKKSRLTNIEPILICLFYTKPQRKLYFLQTVAYEMQTVIQTKEEMLIELKHDKMEANKTHFPFLFRRFLFTETPNRKAFKNIRRLEGHSHLYLFQENLSSNSFLFFPHMAHSHEGANNLPFPFGIQLRLMCSKRSCFLSTNFIKQKLSNFSINFPETFLLIPIAVIRFIHTQEPDRRQV